VSFLINQQQLEFKRIPAPVQLIHYNPTHYCLHLFSEQFKIMPPDVLGQWVLKRQAQFLAGRIAAKNALSSIFVTSENIAIGQHREPLWPKGVFGSISHSGDVSIATAQCQSDVTEATIGIGLDIQAVFDQEEQAKLLTIILSQHDQILFEKVKSSLPENHFLTLIFSAKESYFKAVFSQVKEYFDFDEVSIESIDLQNNQLTLVNANSTINPEIMLVIHYEFLILGNNKSSVITYCSR